MVKITTIGLDDDDNEDDEFLELGEFEDDELVLQLDDLEEVKEEVSWYENEFIGTPRGHTYVGDATPEEFYNWLNTLLPLRHMATSLKRDCPDSPMMDLTTLELAKERLKTKKQRLTIFYIIYEIFLRKALLINRLPSLDEIKKNN